jgi:CheY-like chemotaxis protein
MNYPQQEESPIRLLIVDDNRDVIESLSALFELSGFRVAVATSGSAALSCYASDPADVVLVDLGMPHMNGFELVQGLKAFTRPLLLIAMTGWARPGDVAAAGAAGFDHYFTKPVDADELEWLIRQRLRRQAIREPLPSWNAWPD